MKKFWGLIAVLSGVVGSLISIGQPVKVAAAEQMQSYYVAPISSSQEKISYFDLTVKPNTTQTIKVKITNSSDKVLRFKLAINPGRTSDSGTIIYSKTDPVDTHALFDVRKQITLQKSIVSVNPNSELLVPLKIKVPAKSFEGVVLAGLNIDQLDNEAETKDSEHTIANKLGYQIPIKLRESPTKLPVQLKYQSTKAVLSNGYPTYQVTLRNQTAEIYYGVTFKVKIFKDGVQITDYTSKPYDFAPTADFYLNLDNKKKPILPGDYEINIVANKNKQELWKFSKNFTVKNSEARKINKNSVYHGAPLNVWMVVALIAGIMTIVAVGFLIVLVIHNRRHK